MRAGEREARRDAVKRARAERTLQGERGGPKPGKRGAGERGRTMPHAPPPVRGARIPVPIAQFNWPL